LSVTFLDEYQRDPRKAIRRRLEELWALNADRVAFARFYATPPPAKTAPQSPSVLTSVARPTDKGDNP